MLSRPAFSTTPRSAQGRLHTPPVEPDRNQRHTGQVLHRDTLVTGALGEEATTDNGVKTLVRRRAGKPTGGRP